MKRVILESPLRGDVYRNLIYARACVRDSLMRGEAPIASHLLYPQEGILNEDISAERALGVKAGLAWVNVADMMALYVDHGISPGMADAAQRAKEVGIPIEERRLYLSKYLWQEAPEYRTGPV